MKIIFLDFDGVLTNVKSFKRHSGIHAKADPPTIAALNSIIERTGARIVVSSTWRLLFSLPDLRGLLAEWGMKGIVLDRTPEFPQRPRGDEIAHWIEEYETRRGEIESFVILDDDGDMGKLLPRLVQSEFESGLTPELAERAIEILKIARKEKEKC